MKRTDLSIIAGVALVGLIAAFWFLVLSPKREEASKLGAEVAELEATVSAQEDLAATAEEAEQKYDQNYHQLVVLGKAVPEDADTSSLLIELQNTAERDHVDFQTLTLGEGSADAAAASQVAAPPPLSAPGESSSTESSSTESSGSEAAAPSESGAAPATGESTGAAPAAGTTPAAPAAGATPAATTSTATTAAATETTAATLPLGAAVGPAGLPTMPYDLSFTGGFFQIADFFASLDSLVHYDEGDVGVRGRLLTVNGFSLTPVEETGGGSDPVLTANLSVTTYLTPAEQGAVAGSTPAAPAPTTPPATATTTPTSSTTATPAP